MKKVVEIIPTAQSSFEDHIIVGSFIYYNRLYPFILMPARY